MYHVLTTRWKLIPVFFQNTHIKEYGAITSLLKKKLVLDWFYFSQCQSLRLELRQFKKYSMDLIQFFVLILPLVFSHQISGKKARQFQTNFFFQSIKSFLHCMHCLSSSKTEKVEQMQIFFSRASITPCLLLKFEYISIKFALKFFLQETLEGGLVGIS